MVYNTVTIREEVVKEVERIVEIMVPVPVLYGPDSPPPPPPQPPKVEKVRPRPPIFIEQEWNLKPIKIESVGGALGVPAVISVTPTIIDEGFPISLPLDSPAPPEEVPISYGGGGSSAGRDPASVYGGGMAWKGGENESISSFGFQEVNAI